MNREIGFHIAQPIVSVFLSKSLTGEANEISYRTHSGSDQTAITLSIEGPEVMPRDIKTSSQKHTDTYFQGFKAKLVLFYGNDGGVLAKSSKPQGISIGFKENEAFIYWKIDSIAALESIANSIHRNKRLIVLVVMLTRDDTFDMAKNSEKLNIEVDAISLSFE